MPWGLKRFHESHQLHFLTFSCYRRRANLLSERSRGYFECALERVRQTYGMYVYGYVVMPEHVHLLVNEPERETLALAMQSLKGLPKNFELHPVLKGPAVLKGLA
jgi:putative transposase